ncbi:hypothetical protein [Paenibacillus segetis]|uniref:Glycosyl hydrolase family 32 N-terminal domain-containing protein n=1 Tax=Paenibacillus segetis TaxID=1325360 RepID=A0ABQ1Y716_9BACL|nr:hypothetical protein [Paenibacillus segetis]GGH13657.1 hypothetical protein GCM10008013_06870 [Paenibacillus segetis]
MGLKLDDKNALMEAWGTLLRSDQPAFTGSGMAGSYDSHGVDCPFVFRHHDRFYMMHVGFDGIGYQTALAVSDDLLTWQHETVILSRLPDSGRWDHVGAAGSWILLNSNDIGDFPQLKKMNGRYWMIYHSYPDEGYEAGGAVMGLAWTEDESLHEWHRWDEPIFTYEEGDAWERQGLYKCCLLEHEGRFWMLYNAKGGSEWPWQEETGIAWSEDLFHWHRYEQNPVLPCLEGSFYSQFCSDPYIRHDGERWLNFGFGFDGIHAQGLLAVSNDLLQWETLEQPLLPHGSTGSLDEIHAHKSCVVIWKGIMYHYYCACRPWRQGDPTSVEVFDGQLEFRCIAVATGTAL